MRRAFCLLPLLVIPAGVLVAGDWKPLPSDVPAPKDNPTTAAKVELGRKLYFDPRLSSTGTVSCNTCHNLMEGGDDGRRTSMGVHGLTGPRNAPTVWNSAFNSTQFWDGRADTLEDQAAGPIVASVEMGMPDHEAAVQRIAAVPAYVDEFQDVFGKDAKVDIEHATQAIAAFERTLITPDSPYDRYAAGDESALTAQQVRGLETFDEIGCTTCHSGPAFNGPQIDKALGKGDFRKFPVDKESKYVEKYGFLKDGGRRQVTGKEGDAHRYKVPVLRNVTLTAPYFHNGAVDTLEESVRVMASTQLYTELSEQEVQDIVAFLEALTGEFPEIALPRLPSRPGESVLTNVPVTGDRKLQGHERKTD